MSQTELSNLVNGKDTEFTDWRARKTEQALDLPMYCLDVPDWHFRNNLEYFWQYAAHAAAHREWFDGLLRLLLVVPFQAPNDPVVKRNAGEPTKKTDWTAVIERLRQKQAQSAQASS